MRVDGDEVDQALARLEAEPNPSAESGYAGWPADLVERIHRPLPPGPTPPDPPTAMELLGRYERRGRLFLRISQRTLSGRCGVSQSMISRLERGRAGSMPAERLVMVGEALGRAFPLGYCPHEHRCGWQALRPPPPLSDAEKMREELIARGFDNPFWAWD